MRIGVVGTGISGLAAAWLLSRQHQVTVFEREARLGGHSHTVSVETPQGVVDVDTGFIVYNERNYPEFTAFLDHHGIATEASNMSFSASIDGGALEYSGASPRALFAQKQNLLNPRFYRMLADITRFNRFGVAHLTQADRAEWTLGRFLDEHGFGQLFRGAYLLPMGAAIWSCPTAIMLRFPATSFLRFFANHGLLTVNDQPDWRTLSGRSRAYVEALAAQLGPGIRRSTPVVGVRRRAAQGRRARSVEVLDASGATSLFDAVVMACHADQTVSVLDDGDEDERRILSAFRFQPNRAVLHRDARLMPKRRAAWAAWNYQASRLAADRAGEAGSRVALTYWMNRLQNIDEATPLFVSMNPIEEPRDELVYGDYAYDHPVFDHGAIQAQQEIDSIQGRGGVFHAGAWLGYGFHEDGLRSAIEVAARLGVTAPWKPAPAQHQPGSSGSGIPELAAAGPA